jgi:hypothetical protein
MAVYTPPGARRRRTIYMIIAAVLVGLLAGLVVGRATSRGIDDAVSDAKRKGSDAVTALSRLPIEYEQKLNAQGGETATTLLESVDAAEALLGDAFDAAPWLTTEQKQAATAAITSVRADVNNGVSAREFQNRIDTASKVIARTFGVSANPDSG